jgi:hypothetical protein
VSPSRKRRLIPLSGLAYFLLVMVGNSIAVGDSNLGPDATAAEIVADIRAHDGAAFWFGTALEIAGLLLLPVFALWVYRALRDADRSSSRLPAIALGGAIATTAIKLASGGPALYATVRVDELAPGTVKTLTEIGGWCFVASWITTAAFVGGAGIAAGRSGLLPRPLGIAGAVFAALVPIGMALDVQGGGIPGFLLGLLWIAVASVVFTVRERRHGQMAPAAAAPVAG